MTEGDYYPPAPQASQPEKLSLWQRFKRWPLLARIGTIGGGGLVIITALILALSAILWAVDPDGMQDIADEQAREEREAEREAEEARRAEDERLAEEEAQHEEEEEAEREAENERQRQEEEEAEAEREAKEQREAEEEAEAEQGPEEEGTADQTPEGIDAQIEQLSEVRGFEDAEIYFHEGDDSSPRTSVNASVEVSPGWSESSMCRSAREQTIRGLQFMRDEVTDDYDEVMFSYHAQSEADATGDSSILGLGVFFYDHDTVQSIQDDSVTISNVWDAADSGDRGIVCQRAE